ncbi:beta-ketoacyl-ACP synthase [Gloeocapsopsis sp. IPPAS B-1203]|uniref:beta-ketoacyl-ACP synthase n=1 Tax=Gloeocapsopsis sp. IPPAS B-1203 TaxID=2049454 RepID=UPI000C19DA4D|nr:beta-ketoacyl-ACP synthase [Gloeocapsopsis sp. IPPAS B-1203]PIG94793.1 3-oxoacyl-ACP synthase [Gloeocapsopsis sp. IPPAS B-1203]
MDVVVTGIGLVSSLGTNLETSWYNLVAGSSGIRVQQPFAELKPRPLALITQQPANLSYITQLVVSAAIKDAGLELPLPECGLVIGSSRSHQAWWENLARQYQSQHDLQQLEHWLETLPHTPAIAAARQIKTKNAVLAPMAACSTGIWAIAQAYELIQIGQCQSAIAGAVEAAITPLTLAGFQKMGALAHTGAYPFDRNREGLVLGEGAAVFVLESAHSAQERQAKIYGQILGFGLMCDAYHANTPEPRSKSAIASVKQCLERSKLSPTEIDYIHAHGTATKLNDQNEANLLQTVFPQGVAVSSTKGSTGHTLGASGALGTAFCLMALHHQLLPPCVGLQVPEFDLDFVTTPRQGKIRSALCLSFGFGGQNAVIALGKFNP